MVVVLALAICLGVFVLLANGGFSSSKPQGGFCCQCRNWAPGEDWINLRCHHCQNDPHFGVPMRNPPIQ